MRGVILALMLAAVGASWARADDFRAYDIEIIQPWVRMPAPGLNAVSVFMKLSNTGEIADRLLRASSAIAERAELQAPSIENDEIKTRATRAIDVAPGAVVALQPGGFQVVLTGLREPVVLGAILPLTLTFERGGSVGVTAVVTDADALGPPLD